ncbi:MAG: hypothetical protein KGL55_00375 [Rhodospirillales bacterium]|nr:hypothetical protein [Rhodospirillales bacterium]
MGGGFGEGGLWAAQADFGISDDDLIDEQPQIGLAEGHVIAVQGDAQCLGQLGDLGGRDRLAGGSVASLEQLDLLGGAMPLGLEVGQHVLQRRVVLGHAAIGHQIEQPAHPPADLGGAGAGLGKPPAARLVGLR